MLALRLGLGLSHWGAVSPAETGDPFFSEVVFLSGFEGVDGSTAPFVEESPVGHTFTPGITTKITTDQAKFGNSSYAGFNTTGGSIPDSPDLDISPSNTAPFTIEYWFRQPSRNNQSQPLNRFTSSGNWAFQVRHNSAGNVEFYWSTLGNNILSLIATNALGSVNTWVHYCIEKNTAGKLRIYVDGVMKTSSTPADSRIFASNALCFFNQAGAGETTYMDECRISRVARYDSDSGFAVPTGPFPRMGEELMRLLEVDVHRTSEDGTHRILE